MAIGTLRNVPPILFGSGSLDGFGEVDHLGLCTLAPVSLRIVGTDRNDLQAQGLVRLTAANQDQLYAWVVASEFDPTIDLLSVSIEFIGGTGRFADATGTADLLVLFDDYQQLSTRSLSWVLDGAIDY